MRELRLQHPNNTMWKGAHKQKTLHLCFFHFERFRRGRFWSFCETPTVRTWHLLKARHGISRRFYIKSVRHGCRAGPVFIPWQHAAVRENVQRAWARDSKGGSPRARVSSDLISEMDPGGCREGRGVAFTTTFSFASCKMTGQEEGGREGGGMCAHNGRVRCLPGNHPWGDERAPVKSWCKNATGRNTRLHLWITSERSIRLQRQREQEKAKGA